MALHPVVHRFTVGEYHRMGEAGVFGPDDRLELLDGEVVEMTPIGSRHAACVSRIDRVLNRAAGDRAIVRAQSPIELSDLSEPEPDVALVRPRSDFYAEHHPIADDVLLLVEVSDTTVAFDRGVKLPLYAAAGVAEVWMVDLPARIVAVSRRPGTAGYGESREAGPGEMVTSLAFPDIALAVADILG